jgi:hypothetical protein
MQGLGCSSDCIKSLLRSHGNVEKRMTAVGEVEDPQQRQLIKGRTPIALMLPADGLVETSLPELGFSIGI